MILCAGFGTRLRPLTETTPKPLIPLGSITPLDAILEHLRGAGVTRCVINTHHLAAQIHNYVQEITSPEITLSPESEILETGGGITNALPHFNGDPFFVINGDIWWQNSDISCLNKLTTAWDSATMDALLLLVPKDNAIGYTGKGDYFLDPGGLARFIQDEPSAPYIFSGIRILHPRLFENQDVRPFPIVPLFHQAQKQGRLFGVIHEGPWGDLGTLESLALIRERIAV